MSYRQEVLNVVLAQLLDKRCIVTAPENILIDNKKKRMPDLIVDYMGLRMMIEGEVDDASGAETKALDSARKRVESGIAQIALAIVYPSHLRHVPFNTLGDAIEGAQFSVAVVSEAEATGYVQCDIDYLSEILRHTFDQLVKEDVVQRAVEKLESAMNQFADTVSRKPALVERLADTLGIKDLQLTDVEETPDEESD